MKRVHKIGFVHGFSFFDGLDFVHRLALGGGLPCCFFCFSSEGKIDRQKLKIATFSTQEATRDTRLGGDDFARLNSNTSTREDTQAHSSCTCRVPHACTMTRGRFLLPNLAAHVGPQRVKSER